VHGRQTVLGEYIRQAGARNAEQLAIDAQTMPSLPARMIASEIMQSRNESVRRARMRNILVPVDFSCAAREAVRYASDLARQHQAKLVFLHIVTSSEEGEALAVAKENLVRLRESEGFPPEHCAVLVRAGVPFFEITQIANEKGVDLIVIGRRHQISAVSLGDGHTSERVARYATCPVLLVREPMPGGLDKEFSYMP